MNEFEVTLRAAQRIVNRHANLLEQFLKCMEFIDKQPAPPVIKGDVYGLVINAVLHEDDERAMDVVQHVMSYIEYENFMPDRSYLVTTYPYLEKYVKDWQ